MIGLLLSVSISCSNLEAIIKKVEKNQDISDSMKQEIIYELRNATKTGCRKD